MKKILSLLSLATLTVGLLGSCSKINERIDSLEKRIDGIESTSIASVQQQIDGIKASITKLEAADVTVNGKIDELKATAETHQTLIDALKEADKALGQKNEELESRIAALEGQVATMNGQIKALEEADKAILARIDELKTYVDTEIGKTKDWAEETFATLEQYQQTADDLAALSVTVTGISTTLTGIQTSISGLDTKIDGIDAALQEKITTAKTELDGEISDLKKELEGKIADAISASETGLQSWVNEQLSAYYTAAQMDAKIDGLQNQLDDLKTDTNANKSKIEELKTKLAQLEEALDDAKTTIKAEYEAAIDEAIKEYDGIITQTIQTKIDAVNETITALTGRVDDLETAVGLLTGRIDAIEAMIQSVSITPAYSDGSVEAVGGILTLKCIVSPAEALIGMESLKDSLLIYADSVKVKTKATTPAYMTIEVSEASVLDAAQGAITLKADISEYLPKGEDKALTVAVNIKNGISHFTTEFVPVTVAAANPIVKYVEIAAKYDGSTVSTLRWYRQNLAITGSGNKAWTDDSGSPVKVPGTGEDVVVGDYFQWGTFTGFYGNVAGTDKGLLPYTSFTSTGCGDGSDAFTFKDGKQFNQTNAPYWSGSAYTKYNTTDNKKTLDASDDVASIILGGTWRMPTSAEIIAMKAATYWKCDATDKGYYVYTPNPASDAGKVNDGAGTYNKADALLFFPTAGNGYENTYYDVESIADYWASSLNSTSEEKACHLFFNYSGSVNADSRDSERFRGFSVRPVQDPKATYEAVTSVSLNETSKNITVGGNLQLKATVIPDDATQQGVYWTSSAPTVATVDATGKVTAVAAGTATITATTVDGSKTAFCTVTVIPFVDLGVKTSAGKSLYWAECNLGASNPEDPGNYYMWGATALMYSAIDDNGDFTFVTENPYGDNYKNTWDASLGFNFNNVPFADGVFKNNEGERNVFTKYTTIDTYAKSGTPDNITTLQAKDDAATAKNASWRMPKYDEFAALAENCVLEWTTDYNDSGKAGYIVYKAKNGSDKGKANMNGTWKMWDAANSKYITNAGSEPTGYSTSDIHIFLPAAGYGNDTKLLSKNTAGAYCSSDLNNTKNHSVGAVNFNTSVFNIAYNYFRSYGFSIRPVTEE